MKFTTQAIVNTTDLKGVKASLVFPETGEVIECNVKYLSEQEFEDGDYQTRVPTDPAKLGVVQIDVDYNDKVNKTMRESSSVCHLRYEMGSSISATENWHEKERAGYESYPYIKIDGSYIDVKSLPFEVSCMGQKMNKKIAKTVEAVKFGFTNPFMRCEVSRIKVLKIDRELQELGAVHQAYFDEYCNILNGIYEKYGAGAFESLIRIRGGTEELDYFFKLFNNRRFEIMVVKGNAAPDVEDLSVDFLKITEKSYGDVRIGRQFRHMITESDTRLSTELVPEMDNADFLDRMDVSQFVVTKAVKYKCKYKLHGPEKPKVSFFLVLEFDRSSMQKSAAKVVR